MSWRTVQNVGSHPGAPPRRDALTIITRDRLTLARSRRIETDNTGVVSDTGWGAWGSAGVDLGWVDFGLAARFGSSWVKFDFMIETTAGIGRPWKVIWRKKITDVPTFAVSYTSDEEQVLMPGDSLTITIDATNGTYQQFGTGVVLVIADDL